MRITTIASNRFGGYVFFDIFFEKEISMFSFESKYIYLVDYKGGSDGVNIEKRFPDFTEAKRAVEEYFDKRLYWKEETDITTLRDGTKYRYRTGAWIGCEIEGSDSFVAKIVPFQLNVPTGFLP